jgi:glycosyltransferase involved in cell wall biosynthesis
MDGSAKENMMFVTPDRATLPESVAAATWLGDVKVSVLVPALNEAENLEHVLPRMPAWVHEVVLIDDHCTDDTVAVARGSMPNIVVVANHGKPGKGSALRVGADAATGDILVQLDADGSEDPLEIHAFVGALLAGADYAKGSRFIEGGGTSDMPALRKWGNWALVALARALFRGTKFTDLCYGYNAYWKNVAPLLLDADGFEIETVMNLRAIRAGLRIFEVPSFETERIHGEGKLDTFPDGWRVLKAIVRERLSQQVILAPPRNARHPLHQRERAPLMDAPTNGSVS